MPVRPAPFAHVVLWIAALWCAGSGLAAGKPAPRPNLHAAWGVLDSTEVLLRAAPSDPNATAIVLANLGHFYLKNETYSSFEHHRRVMILTEAGYDAWGTVFIPYYAASGVSKVLKLEAHTLFQQPDGKIGRVDLDPANVFDEKVAGGYRRLRFTFPALTPGCVVEYRYELQSRGLFMPTWSFQESEPVLWSEFTLDLPSHARLLLWTRGGFGYEETDSRKLPWPSTIGNLEMATKYGLSITSRHWLRRDVPALRNEPYTAALSDHQGSLTPIFAGFEWADMAPQGGETWEKLADNLLQLDGFGGAMEATPEQRQKAKKLTAGLSTPESKVAALYDYVRSSFKWSGFRDWGGSKGSAALWETRVGSSGELNLLLTGLLQSAGLTAAPVLLRTRDSGAPYMKYPLLRQFDYVIAAVDLAEDHRLLLDATDALRPSSLLPVRAQNGYGFLVAKDAPQWIAIPPDRSTSRTVMVQAALDSAGALTGRLIQIETGFDAFETRRKLREIGQDPLKLNAALVDELFPEFPGARLDSLEISNRDVVDEPLSISVRFADLAAAVLAGDETILTPLISNITRKNPFGKPSRQFPVEFPRGVNETYSLTFTLPPGRRIADLPADVAFQLARGGATFQRRIRLDGDRVVCEQSIGITQLTFQPAEYGELRTFFGGVADASAQKLILSGGPLAGSGSPK